MTDATRTAPAGRLPQLIRSTLAQSAFPSALIERMGCPIEADDAKTGGRSGMLYGQADYSDNVMSAYGF